MKQCWCHAAMSAWRAAFLSDGHAARHRWQLECERAGFDCAARVEAVALRLPDARARRIGPVLTLVTARGELRFADEGDHCRYRYLGPAGGSYQQLIWRAEAGRESFVLVDPEGEASVPQRTLAAALVDADGSHRLPAPPPAARVSSPPPSPLGARSAGWPLRLPILHSSNTP